MQGVFQIDRHNPKRAELELSLHKPNEEQVGVLADATDRSGSFSYGRYNEIELSIPRYVKRNHELVEYKEFDLIRDKYLVKATYGNMFSEFLVVTEVRKTGGTIPKKHVKLKSRQHELNSFTLKDVEALSYTVRELLELSLKETNWGIGSIDPSLELIINEDGQVDDPDKEIPRRSFEETKITVLNMLYKLAETFGVMLQFDTFSRKISVTTPEKAEIDKGMFASYGKIVKSLDENLNSETVVTRLFVYGRDGMSINEVNPTGQSYLEDFSYYMQGYETDEKGNVLSSSPYMSDSLCQAIIDYNLLLDEKDGLFKFYLDELEEPYKNLSDRMAEMYQLEYDLEIILDNLDIAKAHEKNRINYWKDEEKKQRRKINEKQGQIDAIELSIQDIENDISDLREALSLENNFTEEHIKERNDYIAYGEWSDENIIEVEELYESGKEQFKKMREPVKDLDVSLVQFLNAVECHRDWDKIGLGYVIRIDYEPLDIEFRAIITDMSIDFDGNNLGISISNVDYKEDKLAFLEMLYGTAVSSSERLRKKDKEWSDNIDRTDYLAEFLENPWETSRQRIEAGVDEVVTISRRGIIIRNPRFPNEQIIMQSGIMALSLDNGETWSTSITPYGVVANVLIGKIILAKDKLIVGDDEGTFEITGNVLTVKDRNEVVRLRLGEYEENTFGLQVLNKTGSQVVLDENGILQTWQQSETDNVDQSDGLELNIYLPDDTLSIRQAILRFVLLPFRSYSGTTASGGHTVLSAKSGGGTTKSTTSGGSVSTTTASGGGVSTSTVSGGGVSRSTVSGGGVSRSTANGGSVSTTTRSGAPGLIDGFTGQPTSNNYQEHIHQFTIPGDRMLHDHDLTIPSHTHNFSVPAHSHEFTVPSHTHNFSIPNHTHSFSIPNHSHDVTIPNHSHEVEIPPHEHDIVHGIYKGTFARGVGIIINGINRTSQLGGKFNTSQANIDISKYLNTGQWNTIELTSDTLGRVSADIFLQVFMST